MHQTMQGSNCGLAGRRSHACQPFSRQQVHNVNQCPLRGNASFHKVSTSSICQHQRLKSSKRSVIVAAVETGEEVEEDMMDRMDKCVSSVQRSFATLRTGRASPDMLDRINVDYYGAPTPIRQLAGISVPESSMLVIQPYDKGSMQAIEKAIQMSDLNLPPNNDGKLIRLNIPPLTQERRKDFVKQANKMAEDGRVAIRSVRRDGMAAVKKLKNDGMSEDEAKAWEDTVQEQTDEAVKQVNDLLKKKEDELTKL